MEEFTWEEEKQHSVSEDSEVLPQLPKPSEPADISLDPQLQKWAHKIYSCPCFSVILPDGGFYQK
jgi:hypothetical protein